uniref:40S ribosomal protein S15 n=1 Tax=Heterorhabditis bacteriophora TaxID=37862 RepID=A0A1I7WKW4_HETBA
MMRRFSPLAEDISMLSSALNWEKEPETDEGAMDFLDEEEVVLGEVEIFLVKSAFLVTVVLYFDSIYHTTHKILGSFRDRSGTITQCSAQNNMFTVYSSNMR